MPRSILSLVLLLAASTAFPAETAISDVRIFPGGPEFIRHMPVVVAGDGFLVLWQERDPIYPGPIMARAYDADGMPLQAAAVDIRAGAFWPTAVWTGTEYLVVSGVGYGKLGTSSYPVGSVAVTRLRRDATPVDVASQTYLYSRFPSAVLSLAWNGTHALAVVGTADGVRHLLLLDREGRVVSDTVASADIVAAAADGDGFFLLRRDQGIAVAAGGGRFAAINGDSVSILDRSGVVLEHVVIGGRSMRSIAFDGAAWVTAYLDGEGRVCTASFTSANDIRRSCRATVNAAAPSVAALPRRTFAAWEEPKATQIVTDGGLASTMVAQQVAPASAVDATGLLVAWYESGAVRIGGLKHDGTRREEHVITEEGGRPRIASMADGSLVVWSSVDDGVRAIRVDASGVPIPPLMDLGDGLFPNVASDGDGWIVVHEHDSQVVVTSISAGGFVAGVYEISFGEHARHHPVVAAVSGGYLVAWAERDESPEIMLQYVNRSALPLAAPVRVGEGSSPAIGCGAGGCLVVWRDADDVLRGVPVDQHGRPAGEERTFGNFGNSPAEVVPTLVVPAHDGSFRVFRDSVPGLGGVESFRGRTVLVYSRDGRVYVRNLHPRSRAARR